jgi:hypothetical protein
MAFNYGKCKVMHVGKNNPRHEYFMRGDKLTTTEEERDVGGIFTSNLKPSIRCSRAAGCTTSFLNQLKRNFRSINVYKYGLRKVIIFPALGCYSETRFHIGMDCNFVSLWRRHNCN